MVSAMFWGFQHCLSSTHTNTYTIKLCCPSHAKLESILSVSLPSLAIEVLTNTNVHFTDL